MIRVSLCPRVSDTILMSIPAASMRVAAPWRWSCRRIGGSPDEALEEVGDLARMESGAVFLGEDVAGLDPGSAPFLRSWPCRSR